MIKLKRETQYALIAMRHIALRSKQGQVASAKEIATRYGLPGENTAKVLQRLKVLGWIDSTQGSKGGYESLRELRSITVKEFLEKFEGPESIQMCCLADEIVVEASPSNGDRESCGCEVKNFLSGMNEKVNQFFSEMNLEDVAGNPAIHQIEKELPVASLSANERTGK